MSDIKKSIQHWQTMLQAYDYVHIEFDGLAFDTRLVSVQKARLSDMVNQPDKKEGLDKNGKPKMYTPPCIALQCEDGTLYFTLEDSYLSQGLNGVIIRTGNTVCSIQSRIPEAQ